MCVTIFILLDRSRFEGYGTVVLRLRLRLTPSVQSIQNSTVDVIKTIINHRSLPSDLWFTILDLRDR